MLFSIKETIAFRAVIYIFFAWVLFLLRTQFVQSFFGYDVVSSDIVLRFFFYVIALFTVVVFWDSFAKEKYAGKFIRAEFLLLSIGALFIPATIVPVEGPYLVLVEQFIGGLRNILLLFAFFPGEILLKNKISIFSIGASVSVISLLSFYLNTFWKHISWVILKCIDGLFSIFELPYTIFYERFEMSLNTFTVFIGSQCAGIGMITAFLVLSLVAFLVMVSQHQEILLRRAIFAMLFGVVLVFLVNIMRIALLILIGGYLSPEFAMTTFHSSAGSILFLVFFAAYSRLSLRWVIRG